MTSVNSKCLNFIHSKTGTLWQYAAAADITPWKLGHIVPFSPIAPIKVYTFSLNRLVVIRVGLIRAPLTFFFVGFWFAWNVVTVDCCLPLKHIHLKVYWRNIQGALFSLQMTAARLSIATATLWRPTIRRGSLNKSILTPSQVRNVWPFLVWYLAVTKFGPISMSLHVTLLMETINESIILLFILSGTRWQAFENIWTHTHILDLSDVSSSCQRPWLENWSSATPKIPPPVFSDDIIAIEQMKNCSLHLRRDNSESFRERLYQRRHIGDKLWTEQANVIKMASGLFSARVFVLGSCGVDGVRTKEAKEGTGRHRIRARRQEQRIKWCYS